MEKNNKIYHIPYYNMKTGNELDDFYRVVLSIKNLGNLIFNIDHGSIMFLKSEEYKELQNNFIYDEILEHDLMEEYYKTYSPYV